MATTGGSNTGPVQNLSSLPSIERLAGRSNWATWRFAVETFLELEELWEVVKPEPDADGVRPVVNPAKDRKARAKIILLLEPENYVHVKEARTAQEVWAKLEAAFEDNGLARRVGLLRKLITTSLENSVTMETYVNEIVSTAHQLRGVGFDITEEWIGTLLLAGLPEKFRPMIMALENSGTPITGDSIKTKLLQEIHSPSEKTAFVGRKNFPQKSKQAQAESKPEQQSSSRPKCKFCNKYGHVARECRAKKSSAFCTLLSTNDGVNDNSWYFDSGASEHFTKDQQVLSDVRPASGVVKAADNANMNIVLTGTVKLAAKCTPDCPPISVHHVRFIPGMSSNLLSVSQIVRRGHVVLFQNEGVKVIDPEGVTIATGEHDVQSGLFKFSERTKMAAVSVSSTDQKTWHRRMGHLNISSLKQLKSGLASGIHFTDEEAESCEVCCMGKQQRLPFPKKGSRANEVLEIVHSDICGPMEVPSIGGHRYYISFTDDKTRRAVIYFLEKKTDSEVLRAFNDYCNQAERQTGRKIKVIRTDNGKEYINRLFQGRLRELGIRHQTTASYTPEQNGLAERLNRTIVEKARCLLFEANLPKQFWAEAVGAATYLSNRSPTKGQTVTPEEAWSGRKPNLSHVRVFGSKVMAHVPKQRRQKWDPKAFEAVLVGFETETKAYRLYNPMTNDVVKCRDVTIISEPEYSNQQPMVPAASHQPKVRTFVSLDFQDSLPIPDAGDSVVEAAHNPVVELENESESDVSQYFSEVDEISSSDLSDEAVGDVTITALPPQQNSYPPLSQVSRRSGRERAIPGKYHDFVLPNNGFPHHNFSVPPASNDGPSSSRQGLKVSTGRAKPKTSSDPRTPAEALRGSDAHLWRKAMDEEFQALLDNQTWDLVELPPGKRAIGSKWLFKTKEDEKGNIVRHKARIVAQGFTQKFGVDYDEVFAPVAKQVTFRTLLTVASRRGFQVHHVDVKTAYLNGHLEETIYMRQPEGYHSGDERSVCRLRRSLYGLKQSARVWNQKVDEVFKAMGFKPSKSDPCLYMRNGNREFILVYVDDMIIVTPTEKEFQTIFKLLQSNFVVVDLGEVRQFLGIEVTKTETGYRLNQEVYIRKLTNRFGLESAKPSKVPLDVGYLQQKEEQDKLENNQQYLSLIGGLLYIAVHTRPDIAVSVSILAQKSSCPTQQDWTEAKRVLRYLFATKGHHLQLGGSKADLKMFVDADWAGDCRDRKSNSGFLILFGGGAVAWGSRKQTCVSLSSTEAEFIALAEGCQELIWLQRLVREIGEATEDPTTVYEDNQSTIKMVGSDRLERRTKHIETRFFFVRDLQEKKLINLEYCPTENMLADILTKPLQRVRLEKLRGEIGIKSDQLEEECRK